MALVAAALLAAATLPHLASQPDPDCGVHATCEMETVSLSVAGCQMQVAPPTDANIPRHEAAILRCIKQAAAEGAEYMVTPEGSAPQHPPLPHPSPTNSPHTETPPTPLPRHWQA